MYVSMILISSLTLFVCTVYHMLMLLANTLDKSLRNPSRSKILLTEMLKLKYKYVYRYCSKNYHQVMSEIFHGFYRIS